MAFTTFIMTVSMIAIASAGFPGWPANDSPFTGFPSPMMSSLRFGPMAPPHAMFGMPTFPQNFPFFQFPFFHTMPVFPPMPSLADIASGAPTNGGFTGVIISSNSETKRQEDGTLVKEGGSTIVTNTDGVINIKKTGNNPPEILTKRKTVQNELDFYYPKIKPSNLHPFKKYNNLKKNDDFNNFAFRHTFPAIDPKKIETYVPGAGETFKGHSTSIHKFSTNNNGQVKEGGSATRIDNDNGHVNKEIVAYSSDGTHS